MSTSRCGDINDLIFANFLDDSGVFPTGASDFADWTRLDLV